MRTKNIIIKIITAFLILFILVFGTNFSFAELSDIQKQAVDLNHDGVLDQKDIDLIVSQDFPEKPIDGVPNPNPEEDTTQNNNINIPSEKNGLKVLFIGNSKTFYNYLAEIFKKMVEATGNNVTVAQATRGGKTLKYLSGVQFVKNAIKSQQWDYVILQEQTTASTKSGTYTKGAKACYKLIKENNPNSVVVYDAVWYNRNLTKQGTINTLVKRVANDNESKGLICYTGNAFKKAQSNKLFKNKLFMDGVHPNIKGSYLRACCLYATIYQASPVGINYYGKVTGSGGIKFYGKKNGIKCSNKNGVNKNKAEELQKIAAEIMKVN